MRIITADERLRERTGVKALIVGPPKIGKTSLLRTLDPDHVLFIDLEAGDLAIADLRIDTLRPQTWQECRDLACFLTGPNPSLPPTACYSPAHHEAICSGFEGMSLDKYETYFIDSITVAARLCFRWCEQQPESFSERSGRKDVRGCFGLLGREMIGWLTQLQHARQKSVIFVAVLERIVDEFKRGEWSIQIEGQKTARELPAIVDEIITLAAIDFADDQPPTRCFVCTNPNPWSFPAGDRSGKLEQLEPPDLGRLLAKLTGPGQRKPFFISSPEQTLKAAE
jgi:hypothetical protein